MSITEIKEEYDDIIDELEKKIAELEQKNNNLRNYIRESQNKGIIKK